MKRFLDNPMKQYKSLTDSQRRKLTNTFAQTLDIVKTVFGDKAFKRYELPSDEDKSRREGKVEQKDGRWRKIVNVALFDVVMCGFASRLAQRQSVIKTSDSTREALIYLMTSDRRFIDPLETHTTD